MFGKYLSTKFAGNIESSNLFANIFTGVDSASMLDDTFLSTLRVLLYPRIKNDETIKLRLLNIGYSYEEFKVDEYFKGNGNELVLARYSETNLQSIREWFLNDKNKDSGYVEINKVSQLFQNSMECGCFVCEKTRTTIIFVKSLTIQKFHLLQVAIPVALPWYFKENKVSEEEVAFIKTLNQTDPEKYLNFLEMYYEKYNLRELRTELLLKDVEVSLENAEIKRAKDDVNAICAELDRLNTVIMDKMREKFDADIRLAGLYTRIANNKDRGFTLLSYFKSNKSIVLIGSNEGNITFATKTYLEYFDQDLAEAIIHNENSVAYNYSGSESERNKMKRLLEELFLSENPRIKLRVCAGFTLYFHGQVRVNNVDYSSPELSSYTPNPHIVNWGCLGNNAAEIGKLICNGNYIGAVEQCIASTKNLNWADYTVLNSFFEQMWNFTDSNIKIELPNGDIVDQVDAIAWLEKEDNKGTEDENE